MTMDLAPLLDGLLVIAGLVLVVTGIVMFIRSKSSTDPSSVEAFGIKLNVTHPSLILVLAGVGLMLAPRLLPELPGKIALPETKVEATAPSPPDPQASMSPPPAAATPAPEASPAPASATAATPAVAPVVTPQPAASETASVARPAASPAVTKPEQPRIAVAPPTSRSTPTPKPAPKPAAKPVPAPEPVAASPSPTATAHTPPPASPQPTRPTLAYAALGLPISRSFWSGETRASYTTRINTTLQQSARDVLRMTPRNLGLDQGAFDAWWDEAKSNPRSRELCAAANAPRALLAARVETPASMSSHESAYWPELKLRLYICDNQKQYRQQKTLSPINADNWPFSSELNSEIERFMRTYRADLSD